MVTVLSGTSVGPCLWLECGDGDVLVLQFWRQRVGVEGEGVLQEFSVVPFREIGPRMCAARLLASQRRKGDHRRDLKHVAQLERSQDLGVEGSPRVGDV